MTPQQSKACRALLGWNQVKLAEEAGVGQSTIKDFECGRRNPLTKNMGKIESALKHARCCWKDDEFCVYVYLYKDAEK